MLIRTDTLVPFTGEAINGIRHAIRALEASWTVAELAAIGLVRRIKFVVPDGYRIVGSPSYDITGQETYTIEFIPGPTLAELAQQKQDYIDEQLQFDTEESKIMFGLAKLADPTMNIGQYRGWLEDLL